MLNSLSRIGSRSLRGGAMLTRLFVVEHGDIVNNVEQFSSNPAQGRLTVKNVDKTVQCC